ncbi:uncharacterized protein PGTG_17216 [Puccinia graminis f. sp. tritici CRL 75-36-700-3]|uniref:DUF6589 domain-containing protein n=1 Tax=Puccinia graminis f. sp. tritici (strain CRL 75-36-700-3 / race SCCL) TaxID=418459 RepID=E3L319_PUCGT|nr:uncharacterized protein PGTG_17216 [Puccinia graminis f. sp. tritici CRL 75-36-700-3]EFP90944.2 hypothetical protein PGTG_17216 [Puccinia graminis f. sp. tritici CRL 75-36-700-3]
MQSSTNDFTPKQSTIPEHKRILDICDVIQKHGLTPKKFLLAFLQNPHGDVADRRRLWPVTGLDSTVELLKEIILVVKKKPKGRELWEAFLEDEAVNMIASQKPPRGNQPHGFYQSSMTVSAQFFSEDVKKADNERLANSTPFLFNLLYRALQLTIPDENEVEIVDSEDHMTNEEHEEAEGLALEEIGYARISDAQERRQHRLHSIAMVACRMIAYARNRRNNGLQLRNGVQFLACGVTERVNEYLMYHGLSCGRRTAVSALKTLAKEAQANLRRSFSKTLSQLVSPFITIDNLDMVQRVHAQSVGHQTHTFHGTWGYIQLPSPELLQTLDPCKITLDAFNDALRKVPDFQIEPFMFMPTAESETSYKAVWKSQIARVLNEYLALPEDRSQAIPMDPPPLEKISSTVPNIQMLKLMDAPENSSEGIGKVLAGITDQTGLTPEEFHSRLQMMDGDLATCRNFNSLCTSRHPSPYPQHNLHNISIQLGASHTLWNIATQIFKTHFGDTKNCLDTGAWRCLESLGVPAAKAFPKKDYTLMINHMEQVHEATILYGLKTIMKTEETPVTNDPLPKIPTKRWNEIIEQFYVEFCTGEAREQAAKRESPKLNNVLLRLHEFSTVVEANRAMRAGDIGRLLNVWKMWAVMSQGLRGLTNYSAYLPRLVLLLTEILPPDLAKLFRHSLLFSPSGREGHFVSKDSYLEMQNYWLKFLFNQTGVGTNINRLKNLFSMNILLLRSMMNSIRVDSGSSVFTQSHKNIMTSKSLNVFMQMAVNFDILDKNVKKQDTRKAPGKKEKMKKTNDSFVRGFYKLQEEIESDPQLSRFKLHMKTDHIIEGDSDQESDTDKNNQEPQNENQEMTYEL